MRLVCPNSDCSSQGGFDTSDLSSVCKECGTVVSENLITSEISFDKAANGRTYAVGTRLAYGKTFVGGGRYQHHDDGRTDPNTRERALNIAARRIHKLAETLRCTSYADAAGRVFELAYAISLTKGHRENTVEASCLYLICRQNKGPFMLIDFADHLCLNVFVLGRTFTQLVVGLNLQRSIPLELDPSVYIQRFAKHLDIGDRTLENKVCADALRLIKRMKQDWIVDGRRPAGVAGAALLLAARMNNLRRSVGEMVLIVKVSDDTLHKRLQEFRQSKSAELTVDQFRQCWLEESSAPPAWSKNKKRKRAREVENDGNVSSEKEPLAKTLKNNEGDIILVGCSTSEHMGSGDAIAEEGLIPKKRPVHRETAIRRIQGLQESLPDKPALLDDSGYWTPDEDEVLQTPQKQRGTAKILPLTPEEEKDYAIVDMAVEDELEYLLDNTPDAAVDDVRTAAVADMPEDDEEQEDVVGNGAWTPPASQLSLVDSELSGDTQLSEDDVDPDLSYLDDDPDVAHSFLTEKEVIVKETLWSNMNFEWLKEKALKAIREATVESNGVKRPSRKKRQPRDSTCKDLAPNAPQAAIGMLQKKSFSKRINYTVIEKLFEGID